MFKIKIKFRYNVSKYNILFNLDVMPIWLKSFLYKSNYNYVILVYELKNIWCNYWAFINHESLLVIIESFLMCNTYKYSCKIKVVVRIALQCYIWLPSLLLLWFFDMYDYIYLFTYNLHQVKLCHLTSLSACVIQKMMTLHYFLLH